MSFSLSRDYKPRKFKQGELSDAISSILKQFKIKPYEVEFSATYITGDDVQGEQVLDFKRIRKICVVDKKPQHLSFSFYYPKPKSNKLLGIYELRRTQHYFSISKNDKGLINIYISAPDKNKIKKFSSIFEKTLNLKQVKEEAQGYLEEYGVQDDLRPSVKPRGLRCFISFRFNSRTKVLAGKLKKFLELIGVEVITGTPYEPRPVDDKLRSYLEDEKLDFIVSLIPKGGQSAWIRDEAIFAHAKKCHVVLIVEKGARVTQGFLSNQERIYFSEEHIGDSFIQLLEALSFIDLEKKKMS